MAGHERELTDVLHERGSLAQDADVLAAWSGRLIELCDDTGSHIDLPSLPVAILGLTDRSGHLLSRLGVLTFAMTDLRGPYSPRAGQLRFSVEKTGRPTLHVALAVDGAWAIAEQLQATIRADPANRPARSAELRRPPAKRRTDNASVGERPA